ncbi:hypothetical protein EK21DRAFT_85869 [Setomelanomma holmii]|uniref:Uncharacterized protein n=1 Tax=Setomelanomma holmii TaxID=210430 RepID=A0A9P4HIA1_9PLEO|nr:hypothetical protein EK21DRAFT_85869 [Setomelanomma holmii]
MTDPRSIGPEPNTPSITGQDQVIPLPTQPLRQDTCSSSSSELYPPIPFGRWTLPFHGNCPRCRHYHKAVLVKVNLRPDPKQVSYVRCEKCKEKWAAFGGRSATQISLLSDTTTEPDQMEKELKYSLIEMVRAATNVASLGAIAEPPTQGPSHEPSTTSPEAEQANTNRVEEHESLHHDDLDQLPRVCTYPTVEVANEANIRSRPFQLASKLRRSVSARLSQPHREVLRKFLPGSSRNKISARKLEKSPVRVPPAATPPAVVSSFDASEPVSSREIATDHHVTAPSVTDFALPGPSELHTEVVAYIQTLDTSTLPSMSEHERASWMREIYTAFKARQKGQAKLLGYSKVVETSAQQPQPPLEPSSQLSLEVSNMTELFREIEAGSRVSTFTISDGYSEAHMSSEENNVAVQPQLLRHLQQERRGSGPQRPQSVPNAPRSPPVSHHRTRYSVDLLRQHDADNNIASAPRQGSPAPSRLSQTSTAIGTIITYHPDASQASIR